ncbi:hypothetical protein LCGC14_0993710 [marine sediment metagenome]|uniref:Uncharacterized protein n=1 Tax=marine sediment metagenome TaxID=412755 RepID=A0A0F9RBG6_9ZZZZ
MSHKDYTIESAKACIIRNGGQVKGEVIIIKSPGIKVRGAIDFLTRYKGYRIG